MDQYASQGEFPTSSISTVSGGTQDASAETARLTFLLRGDPPVAAVADVYALYPAGLDPTTVHLLASDDVAGRLVAQ